VYFFGDHTAWMAPNCLTAGMTS